MRREREKSKDCKVLKNGRPLALCKVKVKLGGSRRYVRMDRHS